MRVRRPRSREESASHGSFQKPGPFGLTLVYEVSDSIQRATREAMLSQV